MFFKKDFRKMSTTSTGSRLYESTRAVDEYLQMHYATKEELFPYPDSVSPSPSFSFIERTASLSSKMFDLNCKGEKERVLDVGCAVGGASFALSRYFKHVDAFDFSSAFVSAAKEMQKEREKKYSSLQYGNVFEERVARVQEGTHPERVVFFQGDACNLKENPSIRVQQEEEKEKRGEYDCVHGSNLLCRLPSPKTFLQDCKDFLVRKGGLLILVSPYSWLEEYTPQKDWIVGENGPFEALKNVLEPEFELVDRQPFPFLIREHQRKFQYGVSDCTVWKRKE